MTPGKKICVATKLEPVPYGKNIFRLAGFDMVLVRLDLTNKEWCAFEHGSVG